MVDIIVTACATIAGAAVGGLIPLLAARRQAQLNLLSTAFSNVFAAYTCFISSGEPRNPLPLVAAIEQARMLCGKNRFDILAVSMPGFGALSIPRHAGNPYRHFVSLRKLN